MYLTYDEYQAMGGALDMAAFARHEYRARAFIDRCTHGRLQGEEPVRESVKRLMIELMALEAQRDAAGGREIAAESNDGISVSYLTGAGGYLARQCNLAEDYLSQETTAPGVPLLYAGVAI